MSGLFVAVLWF